MLRVVHVVDSLQLGGTETQAVALVRGLALRGIASHVVPLRDGPLRTRLIEPLVTVEPLAVRGLFRQGFPRAVLALARAMRAHRADVVQTYDFYSNVPGVLAARLARVPVVVASRRGFATNLRPSQRRVDRIARRLAQRTVANAEAIRRGLVENGEAAEAITVIPNCITERTDVTPPQDPVVGMVANLRAPKDHETLLAAFARLTPTVPTAELHLIGDGPEAFALRRTIADLGLGSRVRLLGRLDPSAVWSAINRFAVAVLSTLSEGLPNAVLEAMLAARPVVASDVGGIPEVVQNGVTGTLVPPRDPVALADAIARLLKAPDLAARMGAAGRRHVLTAHRPDVMVDRFLLLYAELAPR